MKDQRHGRLTSLYTDVVRNFIKNNLPKDILVTITNQVLSKEAGSLTFFISVLPEERDVEVLGLLEKLKSDIKKELSRKTKTKFIPNIFFKLDIGEKNRQHIEELFSKEDFQNK